MSFSVTSLAGGVLRSLRSVESLARREMSRPQSIHLSEESLVCFVFLGEFGYELLNWQARLRQLSRNNPSLNLIVASRGATKMLYEDFASFVSLDDAPGFLDFAADGYFVRAPRTSPNSRADRKASAALRRSIESYLKVTLRVSSLIVIFSDRKSVVNGQILGCGRFEYGHADCEGDIYQQLDTSRNDYIQLSSISDLAPQSAKNSLLIMRASRGRITRFHGKVSEAEIISRLAADFPVKLMEFDSNRWDDTEGRFGVTDIERVTVSSLREQVDLIASSRLCVFFTEGDFRSHTYIPPMCGRDVFVLGEAALFGNGNLQLWNQEVFRFGGQIRPLPLETFDPAFGGTRRLVDLLTLEWNK